MIIVDKNEGIKIPYEVTGNKICFDDDLTINLAKREEDEAVHIDICHDADGALVIGAAAGRSYVAEIDIPARAYIYEREIVEDEQGEKEVENAIPVPFDIEKVTLSLWSIEGE